MGGGGEAGGGGGERVERGLRSGTETRCSYKAVTLRGGQRISAKETIQYFYNSTIASFPFSQIVFVLWY